jgi:hypothetical protein
LKGKSGVYVIREPGIFGEVLSHGFVAQVRNSWAQN